MQNKPNFQKSQMNANPYNTMDYEYFLPLAGQINKPNSNPIAKRVKLMQSVYLQRITEKKMISQSEKTNPIQTQFPQSQNERKLIYYRGLQKRRHFHNPGKQSQFKPNFETTTCLSFFRIPYMKPERDRSQAIPCPKIGRGTVSTNSRTVPLSGIFTA